MQVTNSKNGLVELRDFARINLGRDKGSIIRINQEKEVTLYYAFNSDINESKPLLEAAREEIDELVQGLDVPAGIAVQVVHEENEMDDFTFLILAAFVLIYMILASVFESISAPIVLMFTIPLAAIGSLLALLFTSNPLMNANVFIGFIILIGIVAMIAIIWLVPAIPVSPIGAIIIVVFGFFFATVSSRMVGLIGSSNNPVSGMAIATLLIATMVIKASGKTDIDGMKAAIAIGSVICIIAAIAGDTSQDLKTGYILGATPKKQCRS